MKTREQIEKECMGIYDQIMATPPKTEKVILEVLLDIRELLLEKKHE